MKFNRYITELTKFVLSTSVVLGLLLGMVVLVTGGVEGSITVDIDLSAIDSLWFLLGTPFLLIAVFTLLSPLSYFVYFIAFRKKGVDSQP